jgi:endoglucanase
MINKKNCLLPFILALFMGGIFTCTLPANHPQKHAKDKYDLTTTEGLNRAINDQEYMQSMAEELSEVGSSGTFLYGDVNNDGSVNIVDALLTAQYYVGLNPAAFIQKSAADVNDNGVIDIVDALLIAQYYVGEIGSFQADSNMIKNGHFHDGADNWAFCQNDTGQGSMEIVNGESKTTVINSGSYIWSLLIQQLNLNLEAGKCYRLKFRARANSINQTSIRVTLHLNHDPWNDYFERTLAITQTMETYSFDFKIGTTDAEAMFDFHLGNPNQPGTEIYIDDVGLYNIADQKQFVRTKDRQLVVGENDDPILFHGTGFGNQVWGNPSLPPVTHHSEIDFQRLKDMHINSIRFCLNYGIFEDDNNPYVYKKTGWQWLRQNIDWAKKYGIYLILNMHVPQGGYQSNGEGKALWANPENQNRLIALWKAIADFCKNETIVGGFDLVNEPWPTDGAEQWINLATRIIGSIRQVDVNHLIIVEETNQLLNDYNIAYTFHTYKPDEYSFQYTPWIYPNTDGGKYPDDSYIENTNPAGSFSGNPTVKTGNSDWTLYTGEKYQLIDPKMIYGSSEIIVSNLNSGIVYFDNFMIKEYDENGNYLKDICNVNITSISNWLLSGKEYVLALATDTGYDDDYSIKLTSSTSSTDTAWAWNFNLKYPLVQNHYYQLSYYAKGENLPPNAQCMLTLGLEAVPEGQLTLYRNKEYLRSMLDRVVQWGITNNVPLYCGEFGLFIECFKNNKGGLNWVNDMIDLLKEYYISYSYWCYHEYNFGIYQNDEGPPDPAQANQELIDLLTSKN